MATTVAGILGRGVDASKPAAAAGNTGYVYCSTDVNGGTLYQSDGSAWHQIAGAVSGGGASLSSSSAHLSSDVTMTTANTFYDGPTLTLAAGTYLIIAGATFSNATGASTVTAKLWDGTTVGASGGYTVNASGFNYQMTLSCVATLGGSATWKMSATWNNYSGTMYAAAPNNAAGNNATWILAIKIA